MKFLYKLERKFGKYAIRELPAIVIALYAAGYLLELFMPNVLNYCTLDPYYIIHEKQIWRIVTWLIVPPSSLDIFTIIMLFFYYSIAKTLARTWGDFLFNVYIIGGVILTVIGAFVLYGIASTAVYHQAVIGLGSYFSTYYINMSIFLAFAVTYPNMEVLLYFFIPVKMKWMGLLYGAFIVYDFVRTNWVGRCVILISLLNWVIYFLMTRNFKRISPSEIRRRNNWKKAVKNAPNEQNGKWRPAGWSVRDGGKSDSTSAEAGQGTPSAGQGAPSSAGQSTSSAGQGDPSAAGQGNGSAAGQVRRTPVRPFPKINPQNTRHRCVICGRTEVSDPDLEFRYCSKCEGSCEYCQDHLFTHIHVAKNEDGSLSKPFDPTYKPL